MKQTLKITFWFDPENNLAVAELEYNGKQHQTGDIRDFQKCLVISKSTLVENMKFKIVEPRHEEIGYTKKVLDLEVDIQTEETIGYTYIYFEEKKPK
jgi:glyceraldehyde-3-phosphate dehydrogenase/erythrose-4-phosphate dehydrogenase